MSLLSQSLSENRRTLALASPIMAGHLAQMLIGLTDTLMVGHVGVIPLAASALANTILAVPIVFGFGLLSAVSVKASHAHGAGHRTLAAEVLRSGLVLGAIAGLAVAVAIMLGLPWLSWLGQQDEVNRACVTYLILCTWSLPAVFLTTSAKNFCEALSHPWTPFWIMMGGVLLDILLSWILIFGNLGAPALGLEGAGLATLLARIATTAAMVAYPFWSRSLRQAAPTHWAGPGLWSQMRALVTLGLPAGTMYLFEVCGFALAALMMGWIGVDPLAAHQIAMTCVATTFMIPLGLSQAVSVRVGQVRGAGQLARCRPIIFGTLGLTVVLMAIFALLFIVHGTLIASWFIKNSAVIALTANLLLLGGLFQLFDGVQVVCAGALRGFEDTRIPLLIGIVAYWVVALPVSYACAFLFNRGPGGIWVGIVVGLGVAAVALFARVTVRLRRDH